MNEEIVVKCKECDKYFGSSEKTNKCPFCNTEHNGKDEKETKYNKEYKKNNKGSFKLRVKS